MLFLDRQPKLLTRTWPDSFTFKPIRSDPDWSGRWVPSFLMHLPSTPLKQSGVTPTSTPIGTGVRSIRLRKNVYLPITTVELLPVRSQSAGWQRVLTFVICGLCGKSANRQQREINNRFTVCVRNCLFLSRYRYVLAVFLRAAKSKLPLCAVAVALFSSPSFPIGEHCWYSDTPHHHHHYHRHHHHRNWHHCLINPVRCAGAAGESVFGIRSLWSKVSSVCGASIFPKIVRGCPGDAPPDNLLATQQCCWTPTGI